jgi:hypothetical protein
MKHVFFFTDFEQLNLLYFYFAIVREIRNYLLPSMKTLLNHYYQPHSHSRSHYSDSYVNSVDDNVAAPVASERVAPRSYLRIDQLYFYA